MIKPGKLECKTKLDWGVGLQCTSRASVASGVRFAQPAGSCSPGPGGAWEEGGVGVSQRRFRGKGPGASHFESRELRVLLGETLHVEPAPLLFSAGSGARVGATGPIPERD